MSGIEDCNVEIDGDWDEEFEPEYCECCAAHCLDEEMNNHCDACGKEIYP